MKLLYKNMNLNRFHGSLGWHKISSNLFIEKRCFRNARKKSRTEGVRMENLIYNLDLIQAHPWIWRIEWYRDGEKLVPSDNGVVIEEQRLTLRNATKKMSGQYVCSAANVEGDGFR